MKIKQTLTALLVAGAIALTGCSADKPVTCESSGAKVYKTGKVITLPEDCDKLISSSLYRSPYYTCQKKDGSYVDYYLDTRDYSWHELWALVHGDKK